MKINLIIPKRNRQKQLPVCLEYLNRANAERRYDVAVYIIDDADHAPGFSAYDNLTVQYHVKPYPHDQGFPKSALFNEGLRLARPDFDWCSLVDLDMIYRPDFFDRIRAEMTGVGYVVCRGLGLDEATTRLVFEQRPAFERIGPTAMTPFTSDSQISFNRAWYEQYRAVFQTDDLFDDAFVGWGYEDLVVDFVASLMYLQGVSRKVTLKNVWYHLYHESRDKRQERQNLARLYQVNAKNEAIWRAYVQRHLTDPALRSQLSQAMQAHRQGHLPQAQAIYQQILSRDPAHAETLHMLGLLRQQQGQPTEAIRLLRRAVEIEGSNWVYHNNLGQLWLNQRQFDHALQCFDKAIYIYPYFPEAHYNMGNALKRLNRLAEAVEHYRMAVDLKPDYLNAHYNLGNTYLAMGQPALAATTYRQALALNPDFAQAHYNLGTALKQLKRPAEAEQSYQQAVTLAPNFAEAHLGLAGLLHQQGRLAPAIEHYRQVTALNPQQDEAFFQLGNVLQDAGRLEESIAAYERAIALNPASAGAHQNLGAALTEQRQFEAAIRHYRRVIELDPAFVGAHYNLGLALEMQGKVTEAGRAYAQAQRLQPGDQLFEFHRRTLCPLIPLSNEEIDTYRAEVEQVLDEFSADPPPLDLTRLHLAQVMPPYALTYQGRADRPLKEKWAQVFAGQLPQTPSPSSPRRGRPHLGFVVTKGHETIFSRSMQGILNHLSGEQFRLTVACDVSGLGKIRPAITNPAVEWLTFPPRFDQALDTLRRAAFDLLYYWEIGSDTINYFLPFCRPAPVQCLSWGTAVTTGLSQVDYYLSSDGLETEGGEGHYTEPLVKLPSLPTYCYRPAIPDQRPPRRHFGLSDEQHLYFCAQNLLKVHPDFDAVAAEILRRDPQGVLLFLSNRGGHLAELLQQRFARTMPDVVERVRFLPRLPEAEYLALLAMVEVSLDTLHYGGANTSYDAFAAGTPVVSLPGDFQRGRYTYALYQQMGLTTGLVDSPAAYVELAVALGTDRAYRAEVSAKIGEACPALFEDEQAVTALADFFENVTTR